MARTWIASIWAGALITASAGAVEWSVEGDLAETCCCQAACPCVFKSEPTLGHCEGNTLFHFDKARFGDTEIDDLNVVFAYRFGEWVRVYIDRKATDEQMDAVVKLLNQDETFGEFFAGDAKLLSVERADVTVQATEDVLEFAVSDSRVRMEVMAGKDGKPIRIENLSVPYFQNGYTQYKATTTSHEREGTRFDYSGTNGATSRVVAAGSSKDE